MTREQRQQLNQADECEILLWDTYQFIQISRTTDLFEHLSTKHIIDNVIINHLTGFLNKCVLAFKRENHIEIGIFCVTNDEFLGDYPLHKQYHLGPVSYPQSSPSNAEDKNS